MALDERWSVFGIEMLQCAAFDRLLRQILQALVERVLQRIETPGEFTIRQLATRLFVERPAHVLPSLGERALRRIRQGAIEIECYDPQTRFGLVEAGLGLVRGQQRRHRRHVQV